MIAVKPTIEVYLFDEQRVFRAALKSLFERHPRFQVVGGAGSLLGALTELRLCSPDVVVLGLHRRDVETLHALRLIKRARPQARLILIAGHESPTFLRTAFERGLDACIGESFDVWELHQAAQAVLLPLPGNEPAGSARSLDAAAGFTRD